MKLVKAASMGFCRGVRAAIEKAETAASSSSPVYVYGDIVHSSAVMDRLRALGIIRIERIEEAEEPGAVIIRAHGIADDERKAFERKGFMIIDATCPVVLHNQKLLREAEGHVIIIGKKGHPEVLALCGARREAAVVSSPEDVRNLSPGSYKAVLQTTFPSPSPILEEAERQGVRIELLNAICPASGERRKALCDIIPSVDAVVVIGSAFSSNTAELLSIAKESGKPSYLVSDADEIPSEIYSFGTVGITAGASAPDSLVDLVVRKLESGSDKPRL